MIFLARRRALTILKGLSIVQVIPCMMPSLIPLSRTGKSLMSRLLHWKSLWSGSTDTIKSPVLKSSMLKSVRQRCGLGSPPVAFTTNASESVNAMLKRKVDYRRNELPQFLHHLKALIDEQEQEIQKAVVDRAKYALLPKYKKFKKSEDEWFLKMNESERVRLLQRFASIKLTSVHVLYADQKEECSSLSSDFQRDMILPMFIRIQKVLPDPCLHMYLCLTVSLVPHL